MERIQAVLSGDGNEVLYRGRAGQGNHIHTRFQGGESCRVRLSRQCFVHRNLVRDAAGLEDRFRQGFAGDLGAGEQDPFSAQVAQPGQDRFGDIFFRYKVWCYAACFQGFGRFWSNGSELYAQLLRLEGN